MQFVDLSIAGLKVIIPRLFQDERGFFFESYKRPLFAEEGIDVTFAQDNTSFSIKGTIRALHFQSHPGQAKLVTCVQGKIWDVAVDIRPHSPTFTQWEAVELDDQNHKQFYIPVGFAHGFAVLSETARVHYKVSAPYDPKTECSIRWNDPDFNISWPIKDPILAPRDKTSPFFKETFLCTGSQAPKGF
ncbi:MAG TPA: dTDP-4-dehydrorhamnose 3,5-epimerase [Chlamydiales bacterium]|nr:dTDP-4-dehydrorhamnose 3,5-epimerase [Chlamydiales bacterium]